jgi:hypothetical protein
MAKGTQVTYRARARCGCGWKGERRADVKREPSGSQAHADRDVHYAATGHADALVEAGWVGACRDCRVSSTRLPVVAEAWAWVTDHQASDPKHLRRQRERAEHEAIADRIVEGLDA